MKRWVRAHERKLWWAFLAASIVVGAIRNPDCQQAAWWVYAIPVVLFVATFGWLRWTTVVRPRRRAARTDDVDTYIRTAVRGKRIRYVSVNDASVVIYTRDGDLVIEANVEWDGTPTAADHEVLDRLDVGATLSVDLR